MQTRQTGRRPTWGSLALVAWLLLACRACGCGGSPEEPEGFSDTKWAVPVCLQIDCDPRHDIGQDVPATVLSGALMRVEATGKPLIPFVFDPVTKKEIAGQEYEGQRLFSGAGAATRDPGSIVFEAFARRIGEPKALVDVYVTSRVEWQLFLAGFEAGVLRDVSSGKTLRPPYRFGAGEQHLEAVME